MWDHISHSVRNTSDNNKELLMHGATVGHLTRREGLYRGVIQPKHVVTCGRSPDHRHLAATVSWADAQPSLAPVEVLPLFLASH